MKYILCLVLLGLVAGCQPKGIDKSSEVESILKANPDIVFKLIEENPEKFIQAVQKASQKARPQQQAKGPDTTIEDGFKNPMKPVVEESRVLGTKDAKILIVEYTDFECPFCSRGSNTIQEVKKLYGDKVKVLIKHLPLPFHKNAKSAAYYFEAIKASHSLETAHKWSYAVFKKQSRFQDSEVRSFYEAEAKELKIDTKKVEAILANPTKMRDIDDIIQKDLAEAKEFDIQGTPGYLINGVPLKGAYPLEVFQQVIEKHLK